MFKHYEVFNQINRNYVDCVLCWKGGVICFGTSDSSDNDSAEERIIPDELKPSCAAPLIIMQVQNKTCGLHEQCKKLHRWCPTS